jgi:hypothetical protein
VDIAQQSMAYLLQVIVNFAMIIIVLNALQNNQDALVV